MGRTNDDGGCGIYGGKNVQYYGKSGKSAFIYVI